MIENSAGWRYVQSTDSPADYPTVSEHNAGKFQALKTNVDGKAQSSHTHSTSQVTGLDAALAGKAPLATLNTRVPENLSLRLDTTVGTRIFAGNTMIYGDTGWRDITSMAANALEAGNTGKISVRRTTESLHLRFDNVTLLAGNGRLNLFTLPSGWRSTQQTAHVSATVRLSTGGVQTITTEMSGLVAWFSERNSQTGVFTTTRPTGAISGILTVPGGTWPSSLPGLPV